MRSNNNIMGALRASQQSEVSVILWGEDDKLATNIYFCSLNTLNISDLIVFLLTCLLGI